MAYNFAGGAEGDQGWLLPPDPREWLPEGHLAWAVRSAVAGMDISPFAAWYRADGQGKWAYHPRLMTGLIMYCYCKGIRSSRAIEAATFDDVGARVICSNLHPDHATIARFLTRHQQAVKGLLVASLAGCARQGLVTVDVVAGDGTKIKASASLAANATAARLEAEIAGLEELLAAEVEGWLAQARAADAAEDALASEDDRGDGPGAGSGAMTLARLTDKIARRRQAKAQLDAGQAARRRQAEAARADKIARLEARAAASAARARRAAAEADAKVAGYQRRAAAKTAAGRRKRPDGRVPVAAGASAQVRRARQAADRARRTLEQASAAPAAPAGPARPPAANTTDPASRIMPLKKGGFGQLYNAQVLAGRHQVIYAIATHDNPADTEALHPLLRAARANLDAAGITDPIRTAVFDAGYASHDNFTTPSQAGLYVAVTGARPSRGGRKRGTNQPSWQQMAAKLSTPEGQALYKRRAAIIEPVFAQLFNRLGRHLHYRNTKVDLELHLWAASHNLLKAIRAQARQATAGRGLALAT
jgi:transposase